MAGKGKCMRKNISRRHFLKSVAVASALATLKPSQAKAEEEKKPAKDGLVWTQAPCRFCGVGCGVLVGVKDGKVVAIQGNPANRSNKGYNCIKGYHLAEACHGKDRLAKPLIRRDKSTKGTDEGLEETSWEEVLDLAAQKLKEAWKKDKSRIGFWGSGQQTITEGYVISKFWKAGLLSNNIDPNARLCMASAVVSFMDQFQTDEPAGCYDDIDQADVFITIGANMAEAHSVLFSRLCARKIKDPKVVHYDLATNTTRTGRHADKLMIMRPQSDLAITNAISNYLIQNKFYNEDFVREQVQFKRGTENIGHAYKDDYDVTEGKDAGKTESISFEEYAELLAPYTLVYASELSGVSVEDLETLCETYADPNLKVLTLWTMGVNQHSRGTWVNNNINNIHLLTGKIAQPGCGPFSLTGQPSACGTAREVGVFSHRLPADLVVANPQHRRYTEAIWKLPKNYLDEISKPGYHTVKMFRELSNGNIDFLWTANTNWASSMPNTTRFLGIDGKHTGIMDAFVAVNEVYPTESTRYADVVFPCAMWVEHEGQFGNGERRTAIIQKAVDAYGESKPDIWIMLNIAERVLEGETIDGKDAFDHLFGFVWDKEKHDFKEGEVEANKALFEEYRIFSNPHLMPEAQAINKNESGEFDGPLKMEAKQLAPYDVYLKESGLTWPVREVDGKWIQTKWRFHEGKQEEGFDQYGVEMYGESSKPNNISFYKSKDKRPSIIFRPHEDPAEMPDEQYPFWFCTGRLLEHWHTGSMTMRVDELRRALPEALLYMNDADMRKLKINAGDMVKVTSRHGSFEAHVSNDGRVVPEPGHTFACFFDKRVPINRAVHEYYCPLSKEPDFKKTCINIEKA